MVYPLLHRGAAGGSRRGGGGSGGKGEVTPGSLPTPGAPHPVIIVIKENVYNRKQRSSMYSIATVKLKLHIDTSVSFQKKRKKS